MRDLFLVVLLASTQLLSLTISAQEVRDKKTGELSNASKSAAQTAQEQEASAGKLLIGPGDEVEISVFGVPDLSEHTHVGLDGNISMPLVGPIRIAGLTSDGAANTIADHLREQNLMKSPQVSVYVKEYASDAISVAGQVNKPGPVSALGSHRLFDVLQAAGGVSDKAGDTVVVSHREHPQDAITLPLPRDAEAMARNNVELQPGDTVVVSEAGIVYVLGEVNKPGGYVLNSSGGVTVLQVIAAAGGPTRLASVGGAKMIRRAPGGLEQVSLPLKKLLKAKAADMPVKAGDILYVPGSKSKELLNSGMLFSTAASSAIYRMPL